MCSRSWVAWPTEYGLSSEAVSGVTWEETSASARDPSSSSSSSCPCSSSSSRARRLRRGGGWAGGDHRRRIRRTRVAKVRTTEAAQFLRLAISEAQTVVTFAFPVAFERQLKNEPISSAQETRPPRFRPDVRILKCSFEATLLPMLLGGVHV